MPPISCFGAGIRLALHGSVWTEEDRLEHFCRMGLLAVAILHWILFILMVTSADEPITFKSSGAYSNLAAVLLGYLPGI